MKRIEMLPWCLTVLSCLVIWNSNAQSSRTTKHRALLFAVDDYQHMKDLQNPVKNARGIARELENRYGFDAEVVTNPTFEDIEQKIIAYQQAYRRGTYAQDGQLLIFFSGHGVRRGKNGYFMPKDGDPDRPYTKGLEYDFWRSEIDAIDCKHILVAIDACHSITFDPNWENKPDRLFKRPGEQYVDQTLLNHQAYRARLFYTSDATGNETPDRSTFARQLLEGLRTHQSATGYLTSSELFASYMLKAAPTPGGGDFGNDEPGSCFLFFGESSGGGDPEEERFWKLAQQQNTREAYAFYLQLYPHGEYKLEAEGAMQGLLEFSVANEGEKWSANTKNVIELPSMVLVKGGTYKMGSEEGGYFERVHAETVSDFYISRFEVTFEEYNNYCSAIGNSKPDDEGWGQGRRPVINVSWLDAVKFCNWLSKQQGYQQVYDTSDDEVVANWEANGYRLPTEAEWEFAARERGKEVRFGNGKNIARPSDLNFDARKKTEYSERGKYRKQTVPVGTLGNPNELGLHEMSGNVYEWCWDSAGYIEPKRASRGGSWHSWADHLRCTYSYDISPDTKSEFVGFRLAKTAK